MKKRQYKNMGELAQALGLNAERGNIPELKAQLTKEIIKVTEQKELSHQKVADLSSVPRSAVTGIVNGSLQKVTIDRLIRILSAVGKAIEFKIKNVA